MSLLGRPDRMVWPTERLFLISFLFFLFWFCGGVRSVIQQAHILARAYLRVQHDSRPEVKKPAAPVGQGVCLLGRVTPFRRARGPGRRQREKILDRKPLPFLSDSGGKT